MPTSTCFIRMGLPGRGTPGRVIASVASLALLLAACGGDDTSRASSGEVGSFEQLVAEAEAEGSLMLYASVTETRIEALLDVFTDTYDIDAEYQRLTSVPLVQRYLAEADAGAVQADVLLTTTPEVYRDSPTNELFAPLNESVIPSLADYPDYAVDDRVATFALNPFVVIYNTEKVRGDTIPRVWEDVLDERWDGESFLVDPRESTNYTNWADGVTNAHGIDFLETVSGMDYALVNSATPGAQNLAAGERSLVFPAFPAHAEGLMQQGAPIDYVIMDDPAITTPAEVGVSADAPNSAAARLFVQWLLSEDGITTYCESGPAGAPLDPSGDMGCLPSGESPEIVGGTPPDERVTELLDALGLSA